MPAEKHRTRIYLAIVAVFALLVYLLAPILAPFLIAAFLAYLGDPLVDRLEARCMGRTAGVAIVFSAMTVFGVSALLLTAPLIESQILVVIKVIPQLGSWINGVVVPFLDSLSGFTMPTINVGTITGAAAEHWDKVGGIVGVLASWLGNSTQLMFNWVAFATIVPVVTFYLLRDWDILMAKLNGLLPRQFEPTITMLAKEVDDVLAQFLRGQLLLMLAQGVYFSVGLALVGLDLALLIGLLAGAVSFVPYLGAIIGVSAGVLAATMQFHELLPVIWVLVVFGIGQALEGMVLQPLLVGDRIGLHPVAVIFAVMAGGQLFGFVGVLIALPVAAVITVLLSHVQELYLNSALYAPRPLAEEVSSGEPESEAGPDQAADEA
jgi:predicted PurR-regulated permease PerM